MKEGEFYLAQIDDNYKGPGIHFKWDFICIILKVKETAFDIKIISGTRFNTNAANEEVNNIMYNSATHKSMIKLDI